MDKINWTNGQTPLNQTNLNQMQTNIEKSAVVIGSTQPNTGEKVWIKKGKNLLNKNKLQNGAITANSTDSALDPNSRAYTTEWIECLSNKSYTLSNGNRNRWQFKNSSGVITFASGNTITTASDTKYLRCYCYYDENSAGINNVNLQIEQNASATSYEAYIPKKILTKNSNNVFEEFYNEENVNQESYSLGEIRIGTWINGKPLYRKVFSGVTSNTTDGNFATTDINMDISNRDVFFIEQAFYYDSYGDSIQMPYIANSGYIIKAMLLSGNKVRVLTNSSAFNGLTFYVSVLYTKTTD